MTSDLQNCKALIEDTALKNLLEYCTQKYEIAKFQDGTPMCGVLHFIFEFPYKGKIIPVTVRREGQRLIYIAQLRRVDDFNDETFRQFLNASQLPDAFIPSAVTPEVGNSKRGWAVSRSDTSIDDSDPQINQGRFIDALVNLKFHLNKTPPDFL